MGVEVDRVLIELLSSYWSCLSHENLPMKVPENEMLQGIAGMRLNPFIARPKMYIGNVCQKCTSEGRTFSQSDMGIESTTE